MSLTKKIKYKYIAFGAGNFAVIVGLLVIFGWYTGNWQLKSVVSGYTSMKFNTALCIIFLGKSLILNSVHFFRKLYVISLACTVLTMIISFYTLLEMFNVVGFSIDNLFVPDRDIINPGASPGRMSAITATSILVTGVAFLFIPVYNIRLQKIGQYMLHTVSVITFVVILGYLFNVEPLYSFNISTPMALHTAICLHLVSSGASLINYKLGITGLFTGDQIGNILARNLFFKITIAMIVISYLDIYVEKYRILNTGVGSAIFSVAVMVLSFIFIWETSKNVNNLQQKKDLINERLNLIFEALPNALVMGNSDGKIILVNRETEKMFGYKREELLGKELEILLPQRLHAAHPGKMKSFFVNPFSRNFGSNANLYARRKNGEEFPIEIGLTPLKTEDGLVGLASVVDITDRKTSEKIIQEQLRELKIKNQEMEQFNYIASHDLQEPLRTVANYITLLEEDYPNEIKGEISGHLSAMKHATTRMSRLIKNLLDYGLLGRNKSLNLTDVNHTLNDVKADLNSLVKKTNSVIITATSLPTIFVYETELRQLLQNLINNAIKFRKKDTAPVIYIGHDLKDNVYEFYVKDNGIGIEEKHALTIFNIFQRLNREEEYEGYGVGLANCKKIVEMHGGKIWVESNGDGSTFKFTIPILKP